MRKRLIISLVVVGILMSCLLVGAASAKLTYSKDPAERIMLSDPTFITGISWVDKANAWNYANGIDTPFPDGYLNETSPTETPEPAHYKLFLTAAAPTISPGGFLVLHGF